MWICSYGVVNCPECKRTGEELTEIQSADDKIYFRIRYDDKEAAKALGARWDPQLKLWYSPLRNSNLVEMGKKWRVMQPQPRAVPARKAEAVNPPAGARSPKAQMSLESLLAEPTIPPAAEPEPKPGSIPYEEFMAAIRWAEAREAEQKPAAVAPAVAPAAVQVKKENLNAR